MGLRGVWICPTRSHALIRSIGNDGSLGANHWRRGHIASEDHGWFRHRPLIARSRKLSLMMPGYYAPLSHFRMEFEALRAVGIFFSQRLHESGNDGQNSLQRGQVAVTSSGEQRSAAEDSNPRPPPCSGPSSRIAPESTGHGLPISKCEAGRPLGELPKSRRRV